MSQYHSCHMILIIFLSCTYNMFPDMIHCGDDVCITKSHMCDGDMNCPSGRDERNCCKFLRLFQKCNIFYEKQIKVRYLNVKNYRIINHIVITLIS